MTTSQMATKYLITVVKLRVRRRPLCAAGMVSLGLRTVRIIIASTDPRPEGEMISPFCCHLLQHFFTQQRVRRVFVQIHSLSYLWFFTQREKKNNKWVPRSNENTHRGQISLEVCPARGRLPHSSEKQKFDAFFLVLVTSNYGWDHSRYSRT